MKATKIDPRFDTLTSGRAVSAPGGWQGNELPGLAATRDVLWLAPPGSTLTRVDPNANPVVQSFPTNNNPSSVAAGDSGVWVADLTANNVVHVDPLTRVAVTTPVGHAPSAIAVGADAVWVADRGDNAVDRIDPASNAVTATIPVGCVTRGDRRRRRRRLGRQQRRRHCLSDQPSDATRSSRRSRSAAAHRESPLLTEGCG